MAAVTFRRPPRRESPPPVAGRLDVRPPPLIPERTAGGPATWLVALPAVGGLAAVALLAAAGGSGLQLVAAVLAGVSMVAILGAHVARVQGGRDRRIAAERRDYQSHLAGLRRRARGVAASQAAAAFWPHPDPLGLPSLARTSRLWERRPADADFGVIRLGLDDRALALEFAPAESAPLAEVDEVSAVALRRFLRAHATVRSLPVTLALRAFGRVRVESDDPATARALGAAIVGQVVTWHAPADLRLAICVDSAGRRAWDWLKWTPHLQDPSSAPTEAPRLLAAGDLAELAELLADDLRGSAPDTPGGGPALDRPHVLLIVDGGGGPADDPRLAALSGLAGVTVLDLTGPAPEPGAARTLRLRVGAADLFAVSAEPGGGEAATRIASPDLLAPTEAAAVARAVAGYRLPDPAGQEEPAEAPGLADLLGVADVRALDPGPAWRPRPQRDRLRVPIGVDPAGRPVELDLKESARGGMGPHGLVVGAPGSGASELLRTVVLGLAMTHPPEHLNLMLVDVENAGTFSGLDPLPHTSAVITGLADDPALVDRLADALAGELHRRSQLLRTAGEATSLPTLLIAVDGFDRLPATTPDARELFRSGGRAGRSLGVHLLVASSRPDERPPGGAEGQPSYLIRLPPGSGTGSLTVGNAPPVAFRAASVSGPVHRAAPHETAEWLSPQAFRLRAGIATEAARPAATEPDPSRPWAADGRTMLDVAVSRLTGAGGPAHEVWLPPLADPPSLDMVLSPTAVGSDVIPAEPARGLTVPLGWVDRPFEQTRGLLTVDLTAPGGHLAVVGAAGSGTSTALRTAICALSLTHTPDQVRFHCLDFGGGSLDALAGLPHVGSVAGRARPDLVRGIVGAVAGELAERAEGRDRFAGDAFLVVDGWAGVREWFEPLTATITSIAARGSALGVHVLLSAASWAEIPPPLADLATSRIELRLADPRDSAIDPALAGAVPAGRPGRALTSDRLHAMIAVPRIDHRATATGLAAGTADLVRTVRDRWPGPPAPPAPSSPSGQDRR